MDAHLATFEQYAADRLLRERDEIARHWVERLAPQLRVDPHDVLPHETLLNDVPVVLAKSAEFLLVPDPDGITAERLVESEMRSIAQLRQSQGWGLQQVVREFDELAQLLDAAALRWVAEYPGNLDPAAVGRVFGRLNRVPLLMGQVLVGALENDRNALLRQLAAAEEEERTRLSREIHDQLGQLLAALMLGLRALDRTGGQAERIEELERLADRIARETQRLALDLRPPALNTLGLAQALENLLHEWASRTGITADFQAVGGDGPRPSPEAETALYRVAQEGLTNVMKHAGATRAGIVLEHRGRFVTLILEDDGRGFPVAETLASPEKAGRLGVRGMRERLALLGGSLEVESTPGGGTSLFARVPHSPLPEGAAPRAPGTHPAPGGD